MNTPEGGLDGSSQGTQHPLIRQLHQREKAALPASRASDGWAVRLGDVTNVGPKVAARTDFGERNAKGLVLSPLAGGQSKPGNGTLSAQTLHGSSSCTSVQERHAGPWGRI